MVNQIKIKNQCKDKQCKIFQKIVQTELQSIKWCEKAKEILKESQENIKTEIKIFGIKKMIVVNILKSNKNTGYSKNMKKF